MGLLTPSLAPVWCPSSLHQTGALIFPFQKFPIVRGDYRGTREKVKQIKDGARLPVPGSALDHGYRHSLPLSQPPAALMLGKVKHPPQKQYASSTVCIANNMQWYVRPKVCDAECMELLPSILRVPNYSGSELLTSPIIIMAYDH